MKPLLCVVNGCKFEGYYIKSNTNGVIVGHFIGTHDLKKCTI